MIKKIKKIKKLGIFEDYVRDSQILSDFEKYNVFYGRNGCGKTTLTKLFDILESGLSPEYPDLEYEIETESGTTKEWQNFTTKIRVFNQNYVEKNIEIVGSRAKPIYILGEENKKIQEAIEKDEENLKIIKDEKKWKEDEKNKMEVEKDKKFTDVAKIIGSNIAWSSTRNYRKPDAEKDFGLLTHKAILDESKIQECQSTLRQEKKDKIKKISFEIDLDKEYNDAIELCKASAEIITIERLKSNVDISKWVEDGIKIYETHDSEVCEFCWQVMPKDRFKDLLNHFNKADKELKEKIDAKIRYLNDRLDNLRVLDVPNKTLFYSELQTEFVSRLTTLNVEKQNLLFEITTIIEKLEEKKTKTTESVSFERALSNHFAQSLDLINEIIEKHNTKTDNFQTQKDEASLQLKNHYLSEILDDVKSLERNIANIIIDIEKLNKEISKIDEKLIKNRSIISSEHKACEILNNRLETFLGRKEIVFEVSLSGGYSIKRNNKIAKNLSEWEKTAIAFMYFISHLEDQNFNIKEWIVVIDDPVSSLDSNSVFQAFSFLKNSVSEAKQLFLFTHNFDFLRLLLNRVKNIPNSIGRKSYYMINNVILHWERVAEIQKLDPLLMNHESEYHYLFKKLLDFESDGTIASVYPMPNIARKVLETFLMFMVPNNSSPYQKLEIISFDKVKKNAIYKFTNDQSHITGKGFDPSLVPETQKNVKYLLEMIEQTFPEHYNILKSSIS